MILIMTVKGQVVWASTIPHAITYTGNLQPIPSLSVPSGIGWFANSHPISARLCDCHLDLSVL